MVIAARVCSYIQNSSLKIRYFIAFISGLAANLAMAPLFCVPVLIPAFTFLLYLISISNSKKIAFFTGWFFGWGHFIVGLYWFAHALLIEADKFAWLIPFANLGIPAIAALYPAAASLLTFMCLPLLRQFYPELETKPWPYNWRLVIIFSICWVVTEYLRGHLFTGFPWNLIGYCWLQYDSISQFVAFSGIYGLCLLTVVAASIPVVLLNRSRANIIAIVSVLVVLVLVSASGYIRVRTASYDIYNKINLRLVQANIDQKHLWQPAILRQNLLTYLELSKDLPANKINYIIWPESAVPFPINNHNVLNMLKTVIPSDGLLLTGSIRLEKSGAEVKGWNALSIINHNGQIVGSYDKTHLAPFGEYVPLRDWLPIDIIASALDVSDWSRGKGVTTITINNILPPFSPLICYEAIFPGEVTDHSQRAHWLLNVTNDGWFGNSFGPYQHFFMAKARAIEEGLPLVRAANTGISAVIDGYGRVIHKLALGMQGTIDSPLPERSQIPTLYSIYKDKVFAAILVILLIVALIPARRKS